MGWQITFDGTRRELTTEERAAELNNDPFASIWEGGTVVDFDDLSPDVFDAIAVAEGTTTWWGVYRFPCSVGSRMYAIAAACAEHAGLDPVAKPENMRDSRLLFDMIEETEDIEEKPTLNGFPPEPPKASSSSSGLADDLGGDLPKPEVNE